MIRGIHHLAVHVRDLDRMTDFYERAFGFKVIFQHSWRDDAVTDEIIGVPGSAGRSRAMQLGAWSLELFEFSAPAPSPAPPLRPHDRGYTHFSVLVSGIEDEIERLRALGMSFDAAKLHQIGRMKVIYGQDPEGNVIELQEDASPAA